VTTLYPQKLALTSPTGGGRSVGIVRSRTKATEFIIIIIIIIIIINNRFSDLCCLKLQYSGHYVISLEQSPTFRNITVLSKHRNLLSQRHSITSQKILIFNTKDYCSVLSQEKLLGLRVTIKF